MSKCWKDGEWIETSVESINDIGHDKKGNVKLKNVGIDSDNIDFSQDKYVFEEDNITSFRIPGLSENVFGLTLISDTNLVLVNGQDYTIDIENETINLLKKFEKGRVIHYFLTKYMQKFENNEKGYVVNGKYEFTDNTTTFIPISELTDEINYINLVTGTNLVLINGQDYTVNKKLHGINLLKEFEAGDVIYYNLEHQRTILDNKHNTYIPDITVEGRTLTNLLGRAGNAIYKQDWNKTNDNITLEYEQDYFKLTCTEDIAYIAKNIKVKQNSYYLYGCEMYNEDNTGYLTCGTVLGESAKTKRIENEKYRFYIVTSLSSNEISVAVVPRTIKETIVKNIRVYEISEEEFNKIHSMQYTANQLAELYPYVDDCKSVVNPYFECNENLLFENDYYTCGVIAPEGQVNVDESSILLTHMDYSIKTKKNEVYTISVEGDIPSGYKLVLWNMRDNANNDYEKCISDTNVATVTCLDKGVIKYGINCVDSTLEQRKELINKINSKKIRFTLVKGEIPKSYDECHNSRIMFETTLYEGEKITRQNDGIYVKNSEWEEYSIDGSEGYTFHKGVSGFHAIVVDNGVLAKDAEMSLSSKLIRYDGEIVKNSLDWDNRDYEHYYVDLNGYGLVMILPNSLTGWGDDYTPTQDEIRAFFLGWRMCPVADDGSSGQWDLLYNDSSSTTFKQWAKLWCGIGTTSIVTAKLLADVVIGSSVVTCPTTMNDQGYTPYRLIYKKETPSIEEVKTYGELVVKDGVDIVSGSGLVLGEKIPNGYIYSANELHTNTFNTNMFKYKVDVTLKIKTNKFNVNFTNKILNNHVHAPALGNSYVSISDISLLDIQKYADYLIYKPDTVQSYNYIISDKLSLKETLNKTTESISDVYEELAKTKKELEHTRYELSQRSNPNLLINGDFQVWQRGTEFNNIGTRKYTVDRWCAYNGIPTNSYVKKLNKHGGVCIKCVANDEQLEAVIVLDQPLEYIENGIYTLSTKINGKIYSVTGEVVNNNFTYLINISEYILITLSRTNIAFDNRVFTQIIVKEGGEAEVEWIKLELGEYATPFIPKSYSEELRNCQRYYEEIVTNSMINKTDILVYYNFITQKRDSYTISIYEGFYKDKTNKNEINVVDNGTAILTNPVIYSDKDSIRVIRTAQNIYLKSNPEKTFTSGFALVYLIIDAEIY